MIFKTSAESRYILKYGRDPVAVGQAFLVIEPDAVRDTLSMLGLPLVTTDNPLLPLSFHIRDIPGVPLGMPIMDDMQYFAVHGLEIVLSQATIISHNVSCMGTFCDRRVAFASLADDCGCLMYPRPQDAAIVIESRIKFRVSPTFNDTGFAGIDNVRSWRLTKLFLTEPNSLQLLEVANNRQKLHMFRDAASSLTEFINRNGGWTIIGWHPPRPVFDHSNDHQTHLASAAEQKLYISYLYPTDTSIENDAQFAMLRYDPNS